MTNRPYAPPKQERSRDTYERILEATEAFLREKTFQELTITEIVAAAGCSEGPFYARFGDKVGFARHLEERFFVDRELALDRALAITRSDESTPHEVLSRIMGVMIELYREQVGLHRALLLMSRQDPKLGARIATWEQSNLRRAAEVLAVVTTEPSDPNKLEFALFVLRSTVREAILFEGSYSTASEPSDEKLASELATLLLGYLGDA